MFSEITLLPRGAGDQSSQLERFFASCGAQLGQGDCAPLRSANTDQGLKGVGVMAHEEYKVVVFLPVSQYDKAPN